MVCRLRGTRGAKVLPETVHGALLRYFRKNPVVAPRRDGRAVAVDLPPDLLSLDELLSTWS